MYHSKPLVVNRAWLSVLSTNFDDRPFRLNDSANLNIYDAALAAEQVKIQAACSRDFASLRVELRELHGVSWTHSHNARYRASTRASCTVLTAPSGP